MRLRDEKRRSHHLLSTDKISVKLGLSVNRRLKIDMKTMARLLHAVLLAREHGLAGRILTNYLRNSA